MKIDIWRIEVSPQKLAWSQRQIHTVHNHNENNTQSIKRLNTYAQKYVQRYINTHINGAGGGGGVGVGGAGD